METDCQVPAVAARLSEAFLWHTVGSDFGINDMLAEWMHSLRKEQFFH